MIVVDSSGWVEFFTDGRLADEYARRLRPLPSVVTPVIVLYEVYKRLKRGPLHCPAFPQQQLFPSVRESAPIWRRAS